MLTWVGYDLLDMTFLVLDPNMDNNMLQQRRVKHPHHILRLWVVWMDAVVHSTAQVVFAGRDERSGLSHEL